MKILKIICDESVPSTHLLNTQDWDVVTTANEDTFAMTRKVLGISEEVVKELKLATGESEYITIKDDGRKTSEIMAECRSLFEVHSYYTDKELDKQFKPVKSERKFRYLQESDPENANKSANDLEKEGGEYITLRERLLYEILYFNKEKKHLDEKNVTLCAGSRRVDGDVPGVDFFVGDQTLYVGWSRPGYVDDSWRARSVVK